MEMSLGGSDESRLPWIHYSYMYFIQLQVKSYELEPNEAMVAMGLTGKHTPVPISIMITNLTRCGY